MRNLLFLNLLMGAGLAYAAMREYRQDARMCRLLALVASLSLVVSLALAMQ
jgi:hypothetical protein